MKQFYSKTSLFSLVVFMFATIGQAQNRGSLWTKTSYSKSATEHQYFRKSQPLAADYYHLDINALKALLQNAPNRSEANAVSNVVLDLPGKDGKFDSFRVFEAPVLQADLQARFPGMRSYVGKSLNNPADMVRFSVTPQGFHSMLLSSERGVQFIDPFTETGNYYVVYSKRDLPMLDDPFMCGFVDGETLDRAEGFDIDAARNASDGTMRTYRLAIASTIEYSAFHVNLAGLSGGTEAQKKAAVLAAMVVTMTRVNGIYERDVSLTMEIVPNNLDIIFIDSDSFDNNNANTLINQSQTVIDGTIGSANYDIGHTFSTGGGGLAQLNSPCVNGNKARGITGSSAPIGDPYDIDYVAHEMGHQFGSPHTFNGSASNCGGGNRSASNAYEPGSGSTIMAYAGICPPQNVQSNSDAYFHQRSLELIWANISSGNSSGCSTNTATGNSVPTVEAGVNYTIPISTPYALTASSTDPDGIASHTYTWEQYDLGLAGVPSETTVLGPLVRSFEGASNPTRFIPRLQDLVSNYGSSDWEKLVSVSRAINFRVTVRDNDVRGGQTAVDNMVVNVTNTAGPFIVTSQAAGQLVWTPNTSETITWDVAGTTGNGINTANVDILLSTDGGLTYDTVLVANTPNDGSQAITVPNITAPYCRVMVRAVGNIFFSINTTNFAVGDYTYELGDSCQDYFFNANIPVPVNSSQYTGYSLNVPDSFVISDFNINVQFEHASSGDLYYGVRPPFQTTGVNRLASGICTGFGDVNLTYDDEGTTVNCSSLNNGDHVTPLEPLTYADGQNSSGGWIFFMTDVEDNGISGTWLSATLTLCQETYIPVLSVGQNDIENSFSIYPNPNNGEFTIKLKSDATDIKVEVYDIRGRSIFDKMYNYNGNFEQTIKLSNVQSGMYLVKVSDGLKQVTKKIVIE